MNYPARKFNLGKLIDLKKSQLLRRTELHVPGDLTM